MSSSQRVKRFDRVSESSEKVTEEQSDKLLKNNEGSVHRLCGCFKAILYSRSCGRNGPQRSLLRACVGKSQKLSEGLEREHLGKIPERDRKGNGRKGRVHMHVKQMHD